MDLVPNQPSRHSKSDRLLIAALCAWLLPVAGYVIAFILYSEPGAGVPAGILIGVFELVTFGISALLTLVALLLDRGRNVKAWILLLALIAAFFFRFLYPSIKEAMRHQKEFATCEPAVEQIVLYRPTICATCDSIQSELAMSEFKNTLRIIDTTELQERIDNFQDREISTDISIGSYLAHYKYGLGNDRKIYPGPVADVRFYEAADNLELCGLKGSHGRYSNIYLPDMLYQLVVNENPTSFTGTDVIQKTKEWLQVYRGERQP